MLWAAQYEILVVEECGISMTLFVWATDTSLGMCVLFAARASVCLIVLLRFVSVKTAHVLILMAHIAMSALLFKTWAHQFPWSLSITLLWNLHLLEFFYSESFRHDGRKVMKVFSSKLTLSSETKLIAYVLLYCLFVNLAAKNVYHIFNYFFPPSSFFGLKQRNVVHFCSLLIV